MYVLNSVAMDNKYPQSENAYNQASSNSKNKMWYFTQLLELFLVFLSLLLPESSFREEGSKLEYKGLKFKTINKGHSNYEIYTLNQFIL